MGVTITPRIAILMMLDALKRSFWPWEWPVGAKSGFLPAAQAAIGVGPLAFCALLLCSLRFADPSLHSCMNPVMALFGVPASCAARSAGNLPKARQSAAFEAELCTNNALSCEQE